jgi:HK97 family phage major capsid protein
VPINQTVGTSADCSTIFSGEWRHMLVGVRSQLRIEVLNQTFAQNLQVAYLAHMRADVAITIPSAFAAITGVRS